jgi:tetratricopeptide (TPR) repeat protein
MGRPRDWFEAMGRNFKVTQHSHLENGKEREILPWLEMAADLDPQREETYTVTAYWLAREMKQPKEAEQFLRRGLRANPKSYEILFELGRLYQHDLGDPPRARNVWQAALRRWDAAEKGKDEPDKIGLNKILGELAQSYADIGNYDEAIRYFEQAKLYSPAPDALERKIQTLRDKRAAAPATGTTPH